MTPRQGLAPVAETQSGGRTAFLDTLFAPGPAMIWLEQASSQLRKEREGESNE